MEGTKMFEEINFYPGKITFNEDGIQSYKSLSDCVDLLREDLFQVRFESEDRYVIDVGWGPDFSLEGSFKICIIKNSNWENPIEVKRCRTMWQLNNIMINFLRKVKAVVVARQI